MGYSKKVWFDQLEREMHYISSDKFVCSSCANEKYLKHLIMNQGERRTCNFCGRIKKCIPLNDILELVYTYLYDEYSLADEVFMYDSSEGGLQGPTKECDQILLQDLSFMNVGLQMEIINCFSVQEQLFCDRAFIDPESVPDYLKVTWEDFIKTLQKKSRFTLLTGEDHENGDLTPIGFCKTIGHYLLRMDVIKELPASTKIYRARKNGSYELNAEQLGAPKPKQSSINRMSPGGISFFYESFDRNTCLMEATGNENDLFNLGVWELVHNVRLLDITQCKKNSQKEFSIFDHDHVWQRHIYPFLHEFISSLLRPVDGTLNTTEKELEYLPTQVISEYLKNFFVDRNGNHIDGLIYPSTKVQNHNNIVLFYGQEYNLESAGERQILKLTQFYTPKIIYKK